MLAESQTVILHCGNSQFFKLSQNGYGAKRFETAAKTTVCCRPDTPQPEQQTMVG